MNPELFSPKAAILWSTITKEARTRVLQNVWCGRCRTSVEIVQFTGEAKKGDLILKGQCGRCGREVARVVETSERIIQN